MSIAHTSHELDAAENTAEPCRVTSNQDEMLVIYYQNVRGLRTKIDDFFLAVSEALYDIIVLTETWLDEKIYSAQLFGNTYNVYRNDWNRFNSKKNEEVECLLPFQFR